MKKWRQYNQDVRDQHVQFNWTLVGELKLDLVLIGPKDKDLERPYFEMARGLSDERLIPVENIFYRYLKVI